MVTETENLRYMEIFVEWQMHEIAAYKGTQLGHDENIWDHFANNEWFAETLMCKFTSQCLLNHCSAHI
jgi:hypothetical protein